MAREFDGSTQYLTHEAAITTGAATFSAWFKTDTTSGAHSICTVGNTDGGNVIEYGILQVNAQFWAFVQDSTAVQAVSTATLAAGVWYHGCGVFASNSDRRAFINGSDKGTNTTGKSLNTAQMSRTRIAQRTGANQPFDGTIAEVAIYNTPLPDDAVQWLAAGFSPYSKQLQVYLRYLVAYWPLFAQNNGDEPDRAWGNKYSMSLVNAPTAAAHPPIFQSALRNTALLGAFIGGSESSSGRKSLLGERLFFGGVGFN